MSKTDLTLKPIVSQEWVMGRIQGPVNKRSVIKSINYIYRKYDKTRQRIKKQRHHFADKGSCSQT